MFDRKNVLIFPAGSEIGFEIFHALKYSHHVKLFGASGKNDHASYLYPKDRYFEGDYFIQDEGFLTLFNNLLTQLDIDYIFPTHDTVSWFLSKNAEHLAAKVIGSSERTNYVARHKSETYQLFAQHDWCPQVFKDQDQVNEYPVFLKPSDGQGGKGTYTANNKRELGFYLEQDPNLLIVEHLPGDELSIDCFTDFNGELKFIGPRTRERVQMGISFRSREVPVDEAIIEIARTINDELTLEGAWFFQTKAASNGKQKLLEFAPRQASTMGLYRFSGVNFSLLSLFNAERKSVSIQRNPQHIELDRCLHNRYRSSLKFSRVYIDFDETIVNGEQVHDRVMAFLYQCKNLGREVHLITKHAHDLRESLDKYSIASSLFSSIIHIKDSDNKWDYMDPLHAIFIDNYWFDRKEVAKRLGMPVFDVDAVECLLT